MQRQNTAESLQFNDSDQKAKLISLYPNLQKELENFYMWRRSFKEYKKTLEDFLFHLLHITQDQDFDILNNMSKERSDLVLLIEFFKIISKKESGKKQLEEYLNLFGYIESLRRHNCGFKDFYKSLSHLILEITISNSDYKITRDLLMITDFFEALADNENGIIDNTPSDVKNKVVLKREEIEILELYPNLILAFNNLYQIDGGLQSFINSINDIIYEFIITHPHADDSILGRKPYPVNSLTSIARFLRQIDGEKWDYTNT